MALKQLKILGVKVSIASSREVLNFVATGLKRGSKFFISTPNPEIIVKAQTDARLLAALSSADIALADGVGTVWAIKLLAREPAERIPGREFFSDLLSLADTKRLKVYFLGSSPSVNSKLLDMVKTKYPKIHARGSSGPLLDRKLHYVTESDRKLDKDIIEDINAFRPGLLFIAFGAPKQEKWVYKNLPNLNVSGVMVVGGAFDSFVGKTAKPPEWVARGGLEWLWRVLLEPTRIPRILNATVVFPLLVLKAKFSPGKDK
jgi:N-acetylglucosaminyldiphosphoundecaprenol N-acetyl-beta-D-mannosaminyltransferase